LAENGSAPLRGDVVNPEYREQLIGWLDIGYLISPRDVMRLYLNIDHRAYRLSAAPRLQGFADRAFLPKTRVALTRWSHRFDAHRELTLKLLVTRSAWERGAYVSTGVKAPADYDLDGRDQSLPDDPRWERGVEKCWLTQAEYTMLTEPGNEVRARLSVRSHDVDWVHGEIGDPASFPGESPVAEAPNLVAGVQDSGFSAGLALQDRWQLSEDLSLTAFYDYWWADYARERGTSIGASLEYRAARWCELYVRGGRFRQVPTLLALRHRALNEQTDSGLGPWGDEALRSETAQIYALGLRLTGSPRVRGELALARSVLKRLPVPLPEESVASGDGALRYASVGSRDGAEALARVRFQVSTAFSLGIAYRYGKVEGSALFQELERSPYDWPGAGESWRESGSYPVYGIPRHSGALTLAYEPPGPGLRAPQVLLRWRARSGLPFSELGADDGRWNRRTGDAFQQFDLALRVAMPVLTTRQVRLGIEVLNLLDEIAELGIDPEDGSLQARPYEPETYESGRQVRLTLGVAL